MKWARAAIAGYAAAVIYYWLPLWAVRRRSLAPPPPAVDGEPPMIVVLAPARSAADSVPALVASIRQQNYPAHRRRIVVVVDSDGPGDPSAWMARVAGAEVYERRQAAVRTKGASLNEVLSQQLKHEAWDALAVLDIDARPDREFLNRVAAHLRAGAHVVQAAPLTKNPEQSGVSGIGHAGQALAVLVQRGRAALGLNPVLTGTGMVFSRTSLERLGWQTATGTRLSDDGELNYRCALAGVPVTFAPDIALRNDVPADSPAVRRQRRNWFASYVEALAYIGPMLRQGLRGDWRILEQLSFMEFLPASSLTFAMAATALPAIGFAARRRPSWRSAGAALAGIWALHAIYYLLAFRIAGVALGRREWKSLPAFIGMRMLAIGEGTFLGLRPDPGRHTAPSAHPGD